MRRRDFLLTVVLGGAVSAACSTPSTPTAAPGTAVAAPASPTLAPATAPLAATSPVAAASVVSQSAPAGGGALAKLVIGIASTSATQLPTWIAIDKGLFTKHGLDPQLVTIAGGSSPVSALLSGQINVLRISVEAMQADLNGGDLVYVAAPSTAVSFWLYGVPSVKTGADLKGKLVGVTGVGTATYTAARMAVKSLGLDPVKDVTLSSINNVPAILAAMQSGAVAAGAISMPTAYKAKQAGMVQLVDVAKLGIPFPSSWDAVDRKWASSNADTVKQYILATTEAINFERQNPEESMAILGKYTKTTDQAVLRASYDAVVPYLLKVPLPPIEAVKNALAEIALTLPQASTADPARFVDTQYVTQLQAQGAFST